MAVGSDTGLPVPQGPCSQSQQGLDLSVLIPVASLSLCIQLLALQVRPPRGCQEQGGSAPFPVSAEGETSERERPFLLLGDSHQSV